MSKMHSGDYRVRRWLLATLAGVLQELWGWGGGAVGVWVLHNPADDSWSIESIYLLVSVLHFLKCAIKAAVCHSVLL